MKKITCLLLLIIVTTFNGCKKGEDDPLISFRSRKARVVGVWTVTSGTSTSYYSSNNYSSVSNTKFTESTISIEQTIINNNVTSISSYSGTYSYKIIFGKDGSYSDTRTSDGSTYTSSGTWNFTGSIGNLKQKEQIVLNVMSESNPPFNISHNGNKTRLTFDIKELRNKKMVIHSKDSNVYDGQQINESEEEYVFEQ